MPTILNTKEETNKTIPIDTSGESMDIEIENKNDDLEETVAEVSTNEETVTSEEGEEYSQSVKKRIDKLTFKIREAERQKEEALKYANSVKVERDTLKGKITKVDEGYINEYSARVKSELNKAESWASKNEWFGQNEAMTYTALSIHKKLINEESFDGKSDEYYKELDKRMKKEFPHKFEDKNKDTRLVQTVASANRSIKNGRKVVRLTPSQIAIAKRLGVPLEEYAKHVKEA